MPTYRPVKKVIKFSFTRPVKKWHDKFTEFRKKTVKSIIEGARKLWDLIVEYVKKGGEIIADGITVYKNGKWLM